MLNDSYVIWFDFPYGRTYFKDSYWLESVVSSRNIEIPQYTQDIDEAKIFTDKEEALRKGRFYAGKYGYGVEPKQV